MVKAMARTDSGLGLGLGDAGELDPHAAVSKRNSDRDDPPGRRVAHQ
jgi:hypothetical protein